MTKPPTDAEVEAALRALEGEEEYETEWCREVGATLRAYIAAKDAEIARLWDVNHSVAVCAAHVREITDPSGLTSGCWRCTVEEQQEQLAAAENRGFRGAVAWFESRFMISEASAAAARDEADRREGR